MAEFNRNKKEPVMSTVRQRGSKKLPGLLIRTKAEKGYYYYIKKKLRCFGRTKVTIS